VSIDAFVSYALHDAPVANSIVEALEKHGLRCWIAPRDVTPGSHYAHHIMSAISKAKVLVLVLSDSALASKHVGKEVERASSKGRPIIALRTDATPLTPAFEYFLSESQWIDVGAGGVAAVAAKLVEAVRSHADSAVSTGPVAAPAAAGHAEALRLRRWIISAVAVVFAVVFGYLVVDKFWPSKRAVSEPPVAALTPATAPAAAPPISDKSIAVLPFTDMSEQHDQEYFADGLAEEVLSLLATLPDLKVISRTSSFQFKGHNADLRTVGAQLGAAYLVEGSVRRYGDRVRVTAQLISTHDGMHRWSDSYERDVGDILRMQQEIAAALGRALQVEVGGGVPWQAATTLTSTDAYTSYLHGLHSMDRYDKTGFEEAVSYFEHALAVDPSLTRARERLGQAHYLQFGFGFVTVAVGADHLRRDVDSILRQNPRSAMGHALRAELLITYTGTGQRRSAKQSWASRSLRMIALGYTPLGTSLPRLAGGSRPKRSFGRRLQSTRSMPNRTTYLAGRFSTRAALLRPKPRRVAYSKSVLPTLWDISI
jgi:TolB-like protein